MGRSSKQRTALKKKRMISANDCKAAFAEFNKPVPIIFQQASSDEIIKFEAESTALISGTRNKPDYGLAMLKMAGVKIIDTSISGHFVCYTHEKSPINKEAYINASYILNGMAATIFLTKETFLKWLSERGNFFIKLIPCVQDRYLNPSGTDWVIPMYEFREGIDSIAT